MPLKPATSRRVRGPGLVSRKAKPKSNGVGKPTNSAMAARNEQPAKQSMRTPSSQLSAYMARSNAAPTRARGTAAEVSKYIDLVMNPWDTQAGLRYPDELIAPTGVVRMQAETAFVLPADGNFIAALGWKMFSKAASAASVGIHPVLLPPQDAAGAAAPVVSDYGATEAAWEPLSAADRTLACGIRLKLRGLASATYMPPGMVYFIQYQATDYLALLTAASTANEPFFQQMVVAGRGYSCTLQELNAHGSGGLTFLPQGPNSFIMSGTNAQYAAGNDYGTGAVTAQNLSVVPNGGIFVFGTGVTAGTTVLVQYAHHLEYLNTAASSGLVEVESVDADVNVRQSISHAVSRASRAIGGAQGLGPIADLVTDYAYTAAQSGIRALAASQGAVGVEALSLARNVAKSGVLPRAFTRLFE